MPCRVKSGETPSNERDKSLAMKGMKGSSESSAALCDIVDVCTLHAQVGGSWPGSRFHAAGHLTKMD